MNPIVVNDADKNALLVWGMHSTGILNNHALNKQLFARFDNPIRR